MNITATQFTEQDVRDALHAKRCALDDAVYRREMDAQASPTPTPPIHHWSPTEERAAYLRGLAILERATLEQSQPYPGDNARFHIDEVGECDSPIIDVSAGTSLQGGTTPVRLYRLVGLRAKF